MVDVSHAGTVMTITANVTLPVPTPITYSPDDTDPFDAANVTIGDAMMGTNGNIITWSQATMVEFTISVIPKSPSHVALATVFQANAVKAAGGLFPTSAPNNDKITISRVMPDGTTIIIKDCKMTAGTPMLSLASNGRIKTPSYTFKAPPVAEIVIPQT